MTFPNTSSQRSENMRRIKSQSTGPEMAVRRALHAAGFRFTLHRTTLPGCPDIVLPKYRTAIQVRGCFWHSHGCQISHVPKSRLEYWGSKLQRNKLRDSYNDRKLRRLGWRLIVVWECRLKSAAGLEKEISRIQRLLKD